jgi:EF-P beta-lysylation protein EpmB
MIHRTLNAVEESDWKTLLSQSNISLKQLCKRLNIDYDAMAEAADKDFPLRIPEPYLQKIEVGNPRDPLLLQVLPRAQEIDLTPGYTIDALNETAFNPAPGIVHKYQNRLLLIQNGSCAIHCRYCFRRHFPYDAQQQSKAQWSRSLDYIRNNPDIQEVILSGGDPLTLNNVYLQNLFTELADIPQIKRLRIHTRLPVVLPQRIDSALIDLFQRLPMQKVMVIHVNHPNELGYDTAESLTKIKQSGFHLLNQTVLLKDINDDAAILSRLSEKLFENGVLPYYLHLLDKIQGVAAFDVPKEQAKCIMRTLTQSLSGFLVPKLVREIPGEASKTWVHF